MACARALLSACLGIIGLMVAFGAEGTVICGRFPLARDLLTCLQGGRVQSYVRPVDAAHLTAGPDEIRRSGP